MIEDLLTMLPSKNKKNIIFEKQNETSTKMYKNLEYQFEINVVGKEFFQYLIKNISLLYKPSPTSKHWRYTI